MIRHRRTAAAVMAAVMTIGSITSAFAGAATPSDMPRTEQQSGQDGQKDIGGILGKILPFGNFSKDPASRMKTPAGDTAMAGLDLEGLELDPASASNMLMLKSPKKAGKVTTEDTRARGVKINLFDYDITSDNPNYGDREINQGGGDPEGGINDKGTPLKFYGQGGVPHAEDGDHNNYTGDSRARQGIVKPELGPNGYPVFDDGTEDGIELSMLFKPEDLAGAEGAPKAKTVYKDLNHLFQLDDEGYYYIDSDENFVEYDTSKKEKGDFKVYDDTYMVESDVEGEEICVGFYPLDKYNPEKRSVRPSDDLKDQDPPVEGYNHQLGLTMESRFYIPEDAKSETGDDLIFSFSGDDDIWVYIDGKLVLDMGGLHKPTHGEINFAQDTVIIDDGVVDWESPSETIGDEAVLSDLVTLNPGYHKLQVFYMERGGVFSNLSIRTNIFSEIPEDEIRLKVEKRWEAEEHPDTAEIDILADGEVYETLELTDDNPVQEVTLPKYSQETDEETGKPREIKYTVREKDMDGWHAFYTDEEGKPIERPRKIWEKAESIEEGKEYLLISDGRILTGGSGDAAKTVRANKPENKTIDGEEHKGVIADNGYDSYVWEFSHTPEDDEGYEHYQDYWVLKQKGTDRTLALGLTNPNSDSETYGAYVTDKNGYVQDDNTVYCDKLRGTGTADSLKLSTYYFWHGAPEGGSLPDEEQYHIYLTLDGKQAGTVTEDDISWQEVFVDEGGLEEGGKYVLVTNNWNQWSNGRASWMMVTPNDAMNGLVTRDLWAANDGFPVVDGKTQLPDGKYDQNAWTMYPIPNDDAGIDRYRGSWMLQAPDGEHYLALKTTGDGYWNGYRWVRNNSSFVLSDVDGESGGSNYCNKMQFWTPDTSQYTGPGKAIVSYYWDNNTEGPYWSLHLNNDANVTQSTNYSWSAVFRFFKKVKGDTKQEKASAFTLYEAKDYAVEEPLPDTLVVTNAPTGDLSVEKHVEGNVYGTPVFDFTITLEDERVDGDFDCTITTGKETEEDAGPANTQDGKETEEESGTANTQDGKETEEDSGDKIHFEKGVAEFSLQDGETLTVTGIPVCGYTVKEAVTKAFEAADGVERTGEITAGELSAVSFTNISQEKDLRIVKEWDDDEDRDGIRPEAVTVQLLANGKPYGEAETFTDEMVFEALPVYDGDTEIVYTVEETPVDGYMASVAETEDGFKIINRHEPELISITGTKTWDDDDDRDGARPATVTVRLYADGTEVDSKEFTETYTFADLPRYEKGQEIVYTVTEDAVEGYTATIDGYDITNKHTPGETTVTVVKQWEDDNDRDGVRPATVKVTLLANGEAVQEAEFDGIHTFTGLPIYEAGEKIVYTVEEAPVTGYTSSVSGDSTKGFIFTNKHTPGTTTVTVTKVWDDAEDQDGMRPVTVRMQLYADDAAKGKPVVLDEEGGWTYTWEELPEKDGAKTVSYTVKEANVPKGYEAEITGDAATGYTVTNVHTPEVKDIKVTKVWEDNNDAAGRRPASVKVQLFADGAASGDVIELDNASGWTWTWTGLPAKAEGKTITYTVEETEVPEKYTMKVTGSAAEGFTVTNSYVQEVTDIKVTKVWDDKNDQDKLRPASVKVQLLADGAASGEAVVLDSASGWTYTWTGVPAVAGGKAITYTVEETEVPAEYTVSVTGSAAEGFTVTNSHVPAVTDIKVTKVWDDENNRDRLRSAYVRVQLYADGEAQGNVVSLNETNSWTYTWTGLPVNKAGTTAKISYTVEETSVPDGYTMTKSGNAADGFVITNTHTSRRGSGNGSGGGTPHWPGFPTTPVQETGVLGESRLPDFVSGVLGDYRQPQGVLGASRTGDVSTPTLAGFALLMAFFGMAGLLIGRRKENE